MPTRNLTDQYNSALSPAQELDFQSWMQKNNRNPDELYNYDLRGFYLLNEGKDIGEGHLTDQFKKPNHPTFSDESMYDGVDGQHGGHWDDNKTFTPGDTNMYSDKELNDYFGKYEEDYTISPNPMTNPQ